MPLCLHPTFYYVAYKVRPITCQCRHRRGVNVKLYSLMSGPDKVSWPTPRPGHFTPGKETRHPLYKRLARTRRRYGQARKYSPLTGFKPRTAQPVTSRYTDWAIPAATQPRKGEWKVLYKFIKQFNETFLCIICSNTDLAPSTTQTRLVLHTSIPFPQMPLPYL